MIKTLSDKEYLQIVDAKLDKKLAEYHEEQDLLELDDLLEAFMRLSAREDILWSNWRLVV